MRTCTYCGKRKPLTEFSSRGKGKTHSWCKPCVKDYDHKRYEIDWKQIRKRNEQHKKENVEWFNEYKTTLHCVVCKEDSPECLDFHHLDERKEMNISTMRRYHSKESILKEIAKCTVVCSNCHRKIHSGRISIVGLAQMVE